jgi:hypothetical protein
MTTGKTFTDVLSDIKTASSAAEVANIIRNLRIAESQVGVVGAHRLYFASLEFLTPEHAGLNKVQHLNLSCAPKIVGLIKTWNHHGVLVTTIDGLDFADLRHVNFFCGKSLTTEKVRNDLRSDIEKLREAGLWNEMLERGGAWLMNPETKRVIIESWSQVTMADQFLDARCEQVMKMIAYA